MLYIYLRSVVYSYRKRIDVSGYFMYRHVEHTKITRFAQTVCLCFYTDLRTNTYYLAIYQ
jgi:hypothetical protein